MKYFLTIFLSISMLSCNKQTISYKEISQKTDASKVIIKEFGGKLKTKLQQAMKEGGPLNAIAVCNEEAPKIAKELSARTGWEIYRTSLKSRAIKPDAWEISMMQSFEQKHKDGDTNKSLFVQNLVEIKGKPTFRFMQAIETKPICLVCHGENIAPNIAAKIKQLYPQDEATNYKLGDIRGAFSIIQPL